MDQIEVVLNMLRPIITSMPVAEKSELLKRLSQLLSSTESTSIASTGQQQDNSVGGVNFSGGSNNAINFSPIQNQGGQATADYKLNQTSGVGGESERMFEALAELKAKIHNDPSINPLLKSSAEQQVDNLEQELKKPNPNSTLVQQTVTLLKQGLDGVMTLAEPTVKVASLVAKLYGIPL